MCHGVNGDLLAAAVALPARAAQETGSGLTLSSRKRRVIPWRQSLSHMRQKLVCGFVLRAEARAASVFWQRSWRVECGQARWPKITLAR